MSASRDTTLKFECTLPNCNKKFKRRPDLQRHEVEFHSHPKACPVPECDYLMKRRDKFLIHMEKIHGYSREYVLSTLGNDGTYIAQFSFEDPGQEDTNTSQFPNGLEQNNTLPVGSPHEYIVAQMQLLQSRMACANVYNSVAPMTAPTTFCITPAELYGSANMFIYPQNVTNLEHGIFSPSTISRGSYDVPPQSPAPSISHPNLPENSHGLGPFENDVLDDESGDSWQDPRIDK